MLCFFVNDTATTEIYPLSLHDALPIFLRHPHGALGYGPAAPLRRGRRAVAGAGARRRSDRRPPGGRGGGAGGAHHRNGRSEEHTSELQSRQYLVCRLLLEKKMTSSLYN